MAAPKTHSSDDCSVHLLTDAKEGTLVRLKRNEYFFVTANTVHEQYNDESYPEIPAGDLLMLLKQDGWPPSAVEKRFCWSFTFYFLHKDHGCVHFLWDMNQHFNPDLDCVFELAMEK